MLRLELEGEVANLKAEADALLVAEAAAEGRVVEVPDGIRPLELDPAAEGETAATASDEVSADATASDSAARMPSTPPA